MEAIFMHQQHHGNKLIEVLQTFARERSVSDVSQNNLTTTN